MEPLFELKVTTAAKGSREVASHLFRQLKNAIQDGRLKPGSRLPSTRDAPHVFGVSRNTAQDVYDRLALEGLLAARQGSGTYVREIRPESAARPISSGEGKAGRVNPIWEQPDIAGWIGFWHERDNGANNPDPIADLRPALVDQKLFPHATFRQVMARQLRRLETNPASSRSPQHNQGNKLLRRAIAEHIALTRAVACRAEDVLVTSGAQQAFDLIARALVIPGETVVALEDPGYPPMRVPFAAAGARIVPVRVDKDGIVVDEIPDDATIICVCPSHQFPLGMPLSEDRRRDLLRLAERTGAVIVEDDYDGEFRHDGAPLDALRSRGSSSRVIYVGSFSKCMFPAIRLGFMVVPGWALPAMVAAKNATDWHSSVPVQAAVAGFILDGHLARHIRRVRRIYRDRRDRLLALLKLHLGGDFTAIPSYYGMHLAIIARDGIDCEAMSAVLARRGIMMHSLDRYYLGPPTVPGFIIGYAASDADAIELALKGIAEQVR